MEEPTRFLIPADQLPPGFAARLEAPGEPAPARPAATVVLVREAEGGPEALLLRRHGRSGFAADAWVFPGGMVDPGDVDPALPVLCDGPDPAGWAEAIGLADGMTAFGYAAAALREAFEETGILLARPIETESIDGAPPAEAVAALRAELLAERVAMREVARTLGVQLALDRLHYIAHWITPEPEPRRYDTRFFLAEVPGDAVAAPHAPELVEARWLPPAEAVEGFGSGALSMLPPTVDTLRRLSGFASLAALREGIGDRPVPAILPRMRAHPEGVLIEFDPA